MPTVKDDNNNILALFINWAKWKLFNSGTWPEFKLIQAVYFPGSPDTSLINDNAITPFLFNFITTPFFFPPLFLLLLNDAN